MIGIVLVTHKNLAKELLEAAYIISEKRANIYAIGLEPNETQQHCKEKISKAIKEADTGDGVVILTDMFGGSPSNLSLSFLKEGKVEVITGVNLPMLVKAVYAQESKDLTQFAKELQSYGRRNICLASEILNKKIED